MMNGSLEAVYFNGQSSTSKRVSLSIDSNVRELRLHSEGEIPVVWELDNLIVDRYGNILEIRNNLLDGALVRVDDARSSKEIYQLLKGKGRVDLHTRLLDLGFLKIVGVAFLLLGLFAGAYFYLLPPLAERAATLLPESVDDEMGDLFESEVLSHDKTDPKKSALLQEFVSKIEFNNSKPLKVVVVQSNEVNAFALPNGTVVVFSEIIDNMKSYEELAALLAHEVSHVNNRHSMKMICRNLAGYLTVSLLFSDVNGVVAVIAENAQLLHTLSYSRAKEQEADEQGIGILFQNNINPHGAVTLFEQLERESNVNIPKIISSHPLTKDRKKHMLKIISERKFKVVHHANLKRLFNQLKSH
jgi:predicted Zn-dependent protease